MSATLTNPQPGSLVQNRQIGDFPVDFITNAPLQTEVSVEPDPSQEQVFELVFKDIDT